MELKAMEKLFEGNKEKPVVGSTKDLTGHCLAAAGMVEAAFCVMAINDKKVWGNNHLNEAEETANAELLNKPYRTKEIRYAMSNSFAFAGHSSSVIIGKCG